MNIVLNVRSKANYAQKIYDSMNKNILIMICPAIVFINVNYVTFLIIATI
jgi:hypothetical protein